ncbi:serine/threonine-protein kinase [Geodermatophilus sp. TF02-6]|uniref:serine/threonine-protein kinase n=1 Tax=Geodermatophilus sp. TF02-6 TaxID=2250575 RepID=UPI0018F45221|nr:serine/threonine-protein kinase [Geodermatophilus sp. TF02-6]
MTSPPDTLVGARYRLLSRIGGGGMGTVWLARDELLGRQVAMKQMLPPPGADSSALDQQRQRALREGRIAARLSHPHAISVYDVVVEAGSPWLVMEYLPSRSLAEVLQDEGVLRVDQVAQIGAQVSDALAATHDAGIVHRDVKPANILIGRGPRVEGLVKITDFGISHASGDVTLTQTGQLTGTPAYLAPEVAQGGEMTQASDVFSLGATLYACLEGQPPFGMDDNPLRLLHRVAAGRPEPPRRAGPLTEPLTRMIDPDPARRPTTREVRDELVRLAAGRDGDTTTVLLAPTDLRPAPPPGRAPDRTGATGGAAVTFADNVVAPPEDVPAAPDGSGPRAAPGAGDPASLRSRPAPEPGGPTPAPPASASVVTARPRSRRPWAVAALVAALLLALGASWLAVRSGGDGGTAGAPTTAAAPSTQAPAPSTQGAAPSTTATAPTTAATAPSTEPSPSPSQPTTQPTTAASTSPPVEQSPTSAPPAPEPLSAQNVRAFLGSYHELVTSDPRAAYALTGPTLRNAISEEGYVAFWRRFADVRISDIAATDGADTATATLQFVYPDGSSQTERHRFQFLVRNGRLVLDSDRQIG